MSFAVSITYFSCKELYQCFICIYFGKLLYITEPGFCLSPMKPKASPASEHSLVFSSTPSSHTAYSPSSSPWSSLGHVTPTNLPSFSQSYASPGNSFLSTSGHLSFDRVSYKITPSTTSSKLWNVFLHFLTRMTLKTFCLLFKHIKIGLYKE